MATTPTTNKIDPNLYARLPGAGGMITPVKLTLDQTKQWDMTRSCLLWNCPAFTHILYTMMNPRGNSDVALFTKDIPTLATDGVQLMVNPEYFFKHSLDERVFMVAHEICHNIFDHCGQMHMLKQRGKVRYQSGKTLPYDPETMNIATDLVINDLLIESKVGKYKSEWLHDTKIATKDDSAMDAYAKVYKNNPPQKAQGGSGSGSGAQVPGKGRFDQHMPPGASQGQDPTQAQQSRNEQEWTTAIAAAANAARAQGKLPAAMEKFFGNILNPQVPWQDVIQGFFNRKVGSGSYDWRRADRRLIVRDIYAPGRSGFGAGCVVVGFDTSGSIYAVPELLEKFLSEVGGILSEIKPKRLIVLWCDAQVHRADEVDELTDLGKLKPTGGGGTAFEPVFDWIAEQGIEPDALVYMTDGDGSFPNEAPKYPVLWADISKHPTKYPFGDVVQIPNE